MRKILIVMILSLVATNSFAEDSKPFQQEKAI